MELVHEQPQHPHFIRACTEGEVHIGRERYTTSVLVSAHELVSDWPPASLDEVEIAHFEPVLARPPEIVLLGTGERSLLPSPKFLAWFNSRGIGFEAMTTDAACRTFNILLEEGREIVAGLILES